ncbi:reverse transcriptase domain-containing protein [Rhodoplanes sp. Z2-YC6860]|uniref:reverse transcriptase domain-containing protein n=1 Tax=Rhodoplanes sp. Z2-YC6860 TaxID=674703 RepID=UPI00078B5801|nr:reverse transcriptase domain-containing protein [Rhodoplanes sp. Z2-YC6860]AMN41909.1 Retron-type RNA-directed DNA polymerase [Rhodoplanes sp. Z2-YC6860]
MPLNKIHNLTGLAYLLGCRAQQLGYYIYKRPLITQYRTFEIPKRRGGTRTIAAPSTNLKIIQRNLAKELDALFTFKSCVNGFVTDRDIKRNATTHVGERFVLNIDLENFFGSINYGRVFGLLSKPPHSLNRTVAAAIAKACTLNDALPQGAPTSPVISNLICAKMDSELLRFAAANRCKYTRYADDLTFSTNRTSMPFATASKAADGKTYCEINASLRTIIESNGFQINTNKLRLRDNTARQEVTGLIVNERVNVKRRFIRETRAMLHAWRKFGLLAAAAEHKNKFGGGTAFESIVRGKIEFIGQIRGRPDLVFRRLAVQFNALTTSGKIRTALSPEEIVKQATWVIEHSGDGQGTAFFIEKYGLITCAHCLGSNPYIYHPENPAKKIAVTVLSQDNHRDLAALEIPAELKTISPIPLYKGPPLKDGASITLCGYPNHFLAKPIRIEQGKLIRTFPKSAVSYLEVTPKIIGGNSGGPLVTEDFSVAGVAVLGLSGSVTLSQAEFFAVNIAELVAWLK